MRWADESARLSREAGCRYAAEFNIMYKVYILQSIKHLRYYIGHTQNLESRLKKHNSGRVRSTKDGVPWKIVYTEIYNTRSDAYSRELEIKKYKGGIKFKRLLGLWRE